jgi:hypothetical protein
MTSSKSTTKKHPGYEYLEVEVENSIAETANLWAGTGYETISVISPVGLARLGYSLLLKRVKQNPYDQLGDPEEFRQWDEWEKTYGNRS